MKNLYFTFLILLLVQTTLRGAEIDTLFVPKRSNQLWNQQGSTILPVQDQHPIYKSRSKALTLALAHTLIPIGAGVAVGAIGSSNVEGVRLVCRATLLAYGSGFGPSIGNFYAKDYTRGGIGVALRGIGALIIFTGFNKKIDDDEDSESGISGDALMKIGASLIVGSAIWNIITSPFSADSYNKKHNLTNLSFGFDPKSKTTMIGAQIKF